MGFLGMAGVWLGCTGFLVSLLIWVLGRALGPAAAPGVALWEGWCMHQEGQRCPPTQHKCKPFVWKMLSLPAGCRRLMALGYLGVCWKQVAGDGLTQAVVGLNTQSRGSHHVAAALTSFMALRCLTAGPVQPRHCQKNPQERLFS